MSETKLSCTPIGSIEVCIEANGDAFVIDPNPNLDNRYCDIPAEHRAAVALALLGKNLDELAEQVADKVHGVVDYEITRILVAIFGPAAHD